MSETMTGAEMVVRALQDQGVEVLFGYPGGANMPTYDAFFEERGGPRRVNPEEIAAGGEVRDRGRGAWRLRRDASGADGRRG